MRSVFRFSYSKKYFKEDFITEYKGRFADLKPDHAGISLLKDGDAVFLIEYFLNKFGIAPVFINRKMKLPVKIKYSEGLGNDRICSASAAAEMFGQRNILVIDFGTATTFTLVSGKVLKGGLIMPGIKTSLNSLTEKTSLPEVKINFPDKLINNNTADNIKAGVLYQSLFTAERIIKEVSKKYKSVFVAATGGFSGIISKRTKLINVTDPDLVLKGINIIISQ